MSRKKLTENDKKVAERLRKRGQFPRRKKGSRRQISVPEKETMLQLRAMGLSHKTIAEETNISVPSVSRYLKSVPAAELNHERANMALELAGKTTAIANQALEAIKPEDFDKASLSQKAVVAGIMIDKTAAIEKMRREMLEGAGGATAMNGIPLPSDAQGMIQLLAGRIKRIEVLRAELRDDEGADAVLAAQELMNKAQQMAERDDEKDQAIEAEFTDITDLRNPGTEESKT